MLHRTKPACLILRTSGNATSLCAPVETTRLKQKTCPMGMGAPSAWGVPPATLHNIPAGWDGARCRAYATPVISVEEQG